MRPGRRNTPPQAGIAQHTAPAVPAIFHQISAPAHRARDHSCQFDSHPAVMNGLALTPGGYALAFRGLSTKRTCHERMRLRSHRRRRPCPRESRIPRTQLRTRLRGAQRLSANRRRVAPSAPAPVTASTSQTGLCAGRHDVQNRPGATVTSRRPRVPHSLCQTGSPADILHGSERAPLLRRARLQSSAFMMPAPYA